MGRRNDIVHDSVDILHFIVARTRFPVRLAVVAVVARRSVGVVVAIVVVVVAIVVFDTGAVALASFHDVLFLSSPNDGL